VIDEGTWIRVGRDEHPDSDSIAMFDQLAALRDQAYTLYLELYTDKKDDWWRWHTLGAVGWPGAWTVIDFETWSGFGRDVVPVLLHRIRFDLRTGRVDPVECPVDPPILHESSRVIKPHTLQRLHRWSPQQAKTSYERLLNAESNLKRFHILNHRYGQTRNNWISLLKQERIRVQGLLPDKITIESCPEDYGSNWLLEPGLPPVNVEQP